MIINSKVGGTKPPKQPNHLTGGRMPSPSKLGARGIFRNAMQERLTSRPFDRISAYKVRESRKNIEHELRVVLGLEAYLWTKPSRRNPYVLVGCTPEDKAQRLKKIPGVIATELGENLIPAIEALHVEGIPRQDVDAFVASIKSSVFRLLDDCDNVLAVTARSIRDEYGAVRNGTSGSEQICRDALRIADVAMDFAKKHGVL
ncbi:hypothetical protein [Sphingorhabdus sp. EL138]|uniref:hypothetical protein n=1 Tax=Sphingorhabdus sp. EL138 TaxID=2073156 RepID=UPI0025E79DCA|nr:hypothetical protein [Sphingorhabdus sp. EL138]